VGNLRQTGHLEDLGEDGRILEWILKKSVGRVKTGIDLAHYRDKWWSLVDAVMKLRIPYNAGNFLTT
jgi:hypothetical protein